MTNILLATAVVLSTSLSTGAAVDLVDASEIEASATELANSRSEDISVVDLSYSRRTFSVDIELHETVLREPSCTYLITELDYQTLGAGVSPFSVAVSQTSGSPRSAKGGCPRPCT